MKYLLVEGVAETLGCSVRSVHELTRTARIPHRRPAGMRRCLFLETEISAWIDGAELETITTRDGGRVVRPKVAG